MGFLNNAVARINQSSIESTEKRLLVELLEALDKDLVEGGYDPQSGFIVASDNFDEHLDDLEIQTSMNDEPKDDDDDDDDYANEPDDEPTELPKGEDADD